MINSLQNWLEENGRQLTGSTAPPTLHISPDFLSKLPPWYLEIMDRYPLAGTRMRLGSDEDLSHMGVNLKWMTLFQTFEESTEMYPGLAAFPAGWLPFGVDMNGSGDPYFVRYVDEALPVARIFHDAVSVDGKLPLDAVSMVTNSLVLFLKKSTR